MCKRELDNDEEEEDTLIVVMVYFYETIFLFSETYRKKGGAIFLNRRTKILIRFCEIIACRKYLSKIFEIKAKEMINLQCSSFKQLVREGNSDEE